MPLLEHSWGDGLPLPQNPSWESDTLRQAYTRTVSLENNPSYDVKWGRLLGYLLLESSFTPTCQEALAHEIIGCLDDALYVLAEIYQSTFLMACE